VGGDGRWVDVGEVDEMNEGIPVMGDGVNGWSVMGDGGWRMADGCECLLGRFARAHNDMSCKVRCLRLSETR
jgi:hypothetical protein